MTNTMACVFMAIVLLMFGGLIWLDRRGQRRFEFSRSYYGEDGEVYKLNGIDVAPEVVSLMLGRYGVQMEHVTKVDADGVIVHEFRTPNCKTLKSA